MENEKPYWLFLDAERGTELSFNLFNYFPEAHYKQAIDRVFEQEAEDRLRTDGGRYTDTLYAWYDPDTDTYLIHVEAGNEFASPFFEEEEAARRFLDHRAREVDDDSRYEGLTLQKLKAKKIGEAVEVLTDQSGIEDFMTDGGHQIGNPQLDEVWFWYDPAADMIIQEEVEPYEVVGLFESEDDADRCIWEYGKQYGLDDLSHLEKYCADLSYEEQGPVTEGSDDADIDEDGGEQAGFDTFL